MILIENVECLIINYNEHEHGDLFIVFFVKGNGFIKGTMRAVMRRFNDRVQRFHYATVSYWDLQNGSGLNSICKLKLRRPAEESEPAF